jgi:hypothetical protein
MKLVLSFAGERTDGPRKNPIPIVSLLPLGETFSGTPMEYEKIILLRNFFFRCFVIGVLIAILFLILTFALWSTWEGLVIHLFALDEKDVGRIVVEFFTQIRIVLIFFFLVPTLALHWSAKKQQR